MTLTIVSDDGLITLYLLGGLLELGGILSVAVDLWRTGQAVRAWRALPSEDPEALSYARMGGLKPLLEAMGAEFRWQRWAGLAALCLGLLIGTAGNILSGLKPS